MKKINLLACITVAILLFSSCSKFKSTEKKIAECNAGNEQSCMSLAKYYVNDINQATQYYLRACNLNQAEGCTKAGLNILIASQDSSQALSLLDKSCSMDGTKKGCYWLGSLSSNGLLVSKNQQKAMQYWAKACNVGDSESCQALGDVFRDGKGVSQDYSKAMSFYSQACQRNYMNACVSAKEINSVLQSNQNNDMLYQEALKYELGLNGQKEDFRKALSLFLESCDKGNSQACMKLASSYEEGDKVTKNINRAYDYYLKTCNLNDYKGCTRGATLIIGQGSTTDRNKEIALSLLQKSCDANDVEACSLLKKLSANETTSIAVEQVNGISNGHEQVNRMSNSQEQVYSTSNSHEQACKNGNYTSCYELAKQYMREEQTPQNIENVKKLLRSACDNNISTACTALRDLVGVDGQANNKHDNQNQEKQTPLQGSCDPASESCGQEVVKLTPTEKLPPKKTEAKPSKPYKEEGLEDLLF